MEDEISAAKRVFPRHASKIDLLAARDEAFADLCRDFGLAVSEHRSWVASNASERDDRLAEYAMLVEVLSGEIKRALENANVFPLGGVSERR